MFTFSVLLIRISFDAKNRQIGVFMENIKTKTKIKSINTEFSIVTHFDLHLLQFQVCHEEWQPRTTIGIMEN